MSATREFTIVGRRRQPLAEILLPGRIWLVLAVCALPATLLTLVNLSPLMSSWAVSRLFDLNGEGNVAVWYSACMLLGIAVSALACATHGTLTESDKGGNRGWLMIAALFAALAMDEVCSIHELVGELTSSRVTRVAGLPGLYIWVLALSPVWLGLIWTLGRFFWTLRCSRPTVRLAFAALGLWLMVPAFEVLDPQLGAPRWLIVTEESAEMIGEILMLGSVLHHLMWLMLQQPLSLVVHGGPAAAALTDVAAATRPERRSRRAA